MIQLYQNGRHKKSKIFIGLFGLSKYGEELPKSTEENR